MNTCSEPVKEVGDIIYVDGLSFIIKEIRSDGHVVVEPIEQSSSSLQDSGICDDEMGKDDNERTVNGTSPLKENNNNKTKEKTKRKTGAKKDYFKFSKDDELKLIRNYIIELPRRGKDKTKWTKMASLISRSLTHMACQRHLELLIKNRQKYNSKENLTSGEEPSDFEVELDKCVQIWTDVHETDTEDVRQLGHDIRAAAAATVTKSPSSDMDHASEVSSPKIDVKRELLKVMLQHEDREKKHQDMLSQTLDLKRRKLDMGF